MTEPYRIVNLERAHGAAVARLHRQAIPQGFLSRLGDAFLANLYLGIAAAPDAVVWVAVDQDDRVLGFVSGTTDTRICYRQVLLRRGWLLGLLAVPSLVHPANIRHIIETLRYPREQEADHAEKAETTHQEAELLSIAVNPEARGLGLGRKLVQILEQSLRERQYRGAYRVVTSAADPQSNAFYLGVGFRLQREFLHHDHAMNEYIKDLDH